MRNSVLFIVFLFALFSVCQAGEVTVNVNMEKERISLEEQADGSFLHYTHIDAYSLAKPGAPDIPAMRLRVLLPAGAEVTHVAVERSGPMEVGFYKLAHFPGYSVVSSKKHAKVGPDKSIYSSNGPYPRQVVVNQGLGDVRGYTICYLAYYPFTYLPQSGRLTFYNQAAITVAWTAGQKKPAPDNRLMREVVRQAVYNPGDMKRFYPEKALKRLGKVDYDMLIITTSTLQTQASAYATFRNGHGISCVVKTITEIDSQYSGATTQLKIKNCILDYYNNNNISYVFFIGDAGTNSSYSVPDQNLYVYLNISPPEEDNTIPGDIFYSCMGGQFDWNSDGDGQVGEIGDGQDYYPDLAIGRLPVRSGTQITNYQAKVNTYINAVSDSGFVPDLLLSGVMLWYAGDAEAKSENMYTNYIQPYWPTHNKHTYYDSETGVTVTADNLSDQIENDHNFFHMATHGYVWSWSMESGSSFDSYDALALTNTPGIVVTMACLVNAFDPEVNDAYDPCLSEGFIRNTNAGAVLFIGASRYGLGYAGTSAHGPSFQYNDRFFKYVLQSTYSHRAGLAYTQAKVELAGNCSSDSGYRWVQYCLNYDGDPSLQAHTEVGGGGPLEADAGSDQAIACGQTSVTIGGSPTASGGTPPYSYSWTPTTGLSSPSASNPTASPSSTTTYTVVVTDSSKATDSDSVLVTKPQDLSVPTITFPSNGATGVTIAPDISWTQETGNQGYRMSISGTDMAETQIDLPQNQNHYQAGRAMLSYGCTYSVKVRALGDGSSTCTSAYSTTNSFTVEALPATRVLPFATASQKGDFRTNVGLFEQPSSHMTATFNFYSATGSALSQHAYNLEDWSYLPISDITTSIGIAQPCSITIDSDGPFLSIGGIIDNATDDPSVTGSELAQFSQGFTPLVLKTAEWNTHLVVKNMSASQATVTLSAYQISGGTTPYLQDTFSINGNGFFSTDDIISYLGGSLNDVWLLDIDSSQTVCGYARQYTTAHTGGIYPFYGHGGGATTLVFPYMEDTTAYRSNIGLTRTASGSANATLYYYSGGSLQASRATGVSQNQYVPIINALRWIRNSSSSDPLNEYGYVVISADSPVYAIGGPTDNTSNDPSVQGAAYSAFTDTLAPIVLKSGPWATRVVLTNHGSGSTNVTISLIMSGTTAASQSTSVGAYNQVVYHDVIADLFPAYLYGTLLIEADDPIYVYVHQYTNQNTGGLYPVFNSQEYD